MKFLRFDDEFIKVKEIVRISAWYLPEAQKFKPAAHVYMKDGKGLTLFLKHGGTSFKQEFDSMEQAISEAAYRLSSITKAP